MFPWTTNQKIFNPWTGVNINLTHRGCANPSEGIPPILREMLWCPTELDENGFWNPSLDWGYCDDNC